MAKRLNDLIRVNSYLSCLPLEMACQEIYTQLAASIKTLKLDKLSPHQKERLVFYWIDHTTTDDFFVEKNETPDRNKCENLIKLIEIVLLETTSVKPCPDNHTEKWTTIRDFWYRVYKSHSAKGNSNVERVLDPIARLCGYMNLFEYLEKNFKVEKNYPGSELHFEQLIG